MSHLEEIKSEMTDVEIIKKTAESLGYSVFEKGTVTAMDGKKLEVDWRFGNNFGVKQTKDSKSYDLVGEFWYERNKQESRDHKSFVNAFRIRYAELMIERDLTKGRFKKVERHLDKETGTVRLVYSK